MARRSRNERILVTAAIHDDLQLRYLSVTLHDAEYSQYINICTTNPTENTGRFGGTQAGADGRDGRDGRDGAASEGGEGGSGEATAVHLRVRCQHVARWTGGQGCSAPSTQRPNSKILRRRV